MENIVNSWWMYLLGAIVCIYVLVGCVIFILRAINDGKRYGMQTKVMKDALIHSAIFSLLPSISILIGLVALSGKIGIPFPWIRLSVIGALHYEASAVGAAYPDITLATMTSAQFVTIAFVMTLGILTGPIFCLFFMKTYDKKVLAKLSNQGTEEVQEQDQSTPKPKKKSFGPILFNAAFIAMICSFLAEEFAKLKNIGTEDSTALSSYIPTVVVLVSFGSMALLSFIAKKFKLQWLNTFALGFSMIIGMAVAVVLNIAF